MESKAIDVYKGLTRAEYLQDKAQLKGFNAIESDWKELFRWIMSVGKQIDCCDKDDQKNSNLAELWLNHIYTVLIDILQNEAERDENEYIQNIGIKKEGQEVSDLRSDIEEWINRIDQYIRIQMMQGNDAETCPAIEVAKNVKRELEQSLHSCSEVVPEVEIATTHSTMWKAINEIKKKGDSYLHLIEKSGNMDSGLSLLLVFIRNYSKVVNRFNHRFSLLPDFYHDRVLMVSPQKAIQDRTQLLITPSDTAKGYLLPEKTKFIAGKKEDDTELIYATEKEEYISGMKIKDAFSVFQTDDNGGEIYRKRLDIDGVTPLQIFEKDKNCSEYTCGWMIESRVLLAKEGEAQINIDFLLTKESAKNIATNTIDENAFSVYVSDSKGWSLIENKCKYKEEDGRGILNILIDKHEIKDSFVPASVALHKLSSDFPLLRILIKNTKKYYDFAKLIVFDEVHIGLEIQHSHNIKLYNELGEIDISKPFYPFGTQAECGSWFRFGNEEIVQKKVTGINLCGVWNKIPKTDNGYEDIYRYWYYKYDDKTQKYEPDIRIANGSFQIQCKVLVNGGLANVEMLSKNLFLSIIGAKIDYAFIGLILTEGVLLNRTDNDLDRCYPFRIILKEPDIGFGMEEYRNVFAERMVFNSNANNADKRPLPTAPIIPMLADIELSYTAAEKIELLKPRNSTNNGIRLSRVTDLNEYRFNSIEEEAQLLFISEDVNMHTIYLGISNTLCKKHIRMYFDLSFAMHDLDQNDVDSEIKSTLEWYFSDKNNWTPLASKYVLKDETYGLTQSGSVELEMPELITDSLLDNHKLLWLKVYVNNKEKTPLVIRNIYMDYIPVVAENGDGMPLPSLSINKLKVENDKIAKIIQPIPGYGGKVMESKVRSSARQSSRIINRLRALTPADYEQLILERFPEIEKVCCIPASDAARPDGPPVHQVNIVVFSRSNDSVYPYTPVWKLNEIKQYILNFVSPCVMVNVINPLYETVEVHCISTVKLEVTADGETTRRMVDNVTNYFAEWISKGTLPDLCRSYYCKTLHSILANDKDVVKVLKLSINDKIIVDINVAIEDLYYDGKTPWSVLVPQPIKMQLLFYTGGIGNAMIEYNFIIN